MNKLNVLVTRSSPQGEMLCQRINEIGLNAIYFSTIEIVPPEKKDLFRQQISKLDQFDWLIFVSPHAVMQTVPVIAEYWPVVPAHIKIAAVGASTALALENANIAVTAYPVEDWRTEGLLALPDFQQIENKKIAIICGANGRELLADSLRQRRAIVTLLVAYQRRLPTKDAREVIGLFQASAINIIICTSMDGLQNLMVLLGEHNWSHIFKVTLIVVSERIAQRAKTLGFKKILVAKNASHEGILEALNR